MTTVRDLFEYAGVTYGGVVRWGDQVQLVGPGVYVISTNANPDDGTGLSDCPLNSAAVASLLAARPEATVDGKHADSQTIADRLAAMWPAGESVVYVGLAGLSTQHRVAQFYRTAIGARAPHAGGWPIKMMDTTRLWVHYGQTDSPAVAEVAMVNRFVEGLPDDVRRALIDPSAPLPFANLTFPAGRRKSHGFRGVKAARNAAADGTNDLVTGDEQSPPSITSRDSPLPTEVAMTRPTQNVTAADIASGQIRIPRQSKSLFPVSKSEIHVELGGEAHSATWDPRTAGEMERSGVIRVGRNVLKRHISAGGPRAVERTAGGYRIS